MECPGYFHILSNAIQNNDVPYTSWTVFALFTNDRQPSEIYLSVSS